MRLIPILATLLMGTTCQLLSGTSPDSRDRTISQLQHTGWTAREGAPGSIQSLAQTTDGYMWLGTAYGLFRFDGVHFDHYKLPSGENFNSENISSLMPTSDGGLWIGLQYGNVAFMKDGRILSYGESEGLPPGTVYEFTVDREGAVWAAVNGGLARFEGSRWRRIGEDWAYTGKSAKAVFVDRDGTLWVASEDTVVFLPRGQRIFQKTGERLANRVFQIAQAPDGTLWMTEALSAVVRPIAVPGRENSQPSPIDVKASRLLIDRAGSLWTGGGGDGIHRVSTSGRPKGRNLAQNSQKPENFTRRDGLTSDNATPALEDREGSIWVITSNGLDRFRASNLVPIALSKGAGFDYGAMLVGGEPGTVLAVRLTGRNELSLMDLRSTITTIHGVAGAIRCAYRDADGNIWLGGGPGGGLWRFTNGRVVRVPLPEGIRTSDIQAITKDRSGGFWVSIIRNGVFRWANGVWTPFGNRADLPRLSPVTLLTDSAGRVWFGYMGSTIAVLDGSTLKTFSPQEGLDVVNIEAIYEHAGHIWVGGERGLAVFQDNHFHALTTDGDIELKGISGIVETAGGDLWLNAAPGIIHIPAPEVRRALEDPDWHVHGELFDFRDGLPGTARQLSVPSALASSDGRLWFMVTNDSAVQIDPQHLSRNAIPPPVFVRSLDSDGREYALTTDLKLPVRTTRVHIEYTALNLSVPERVRFRYKLEGVDKDWQDVGTRREAFYTGLGPGEYHFHVIACNNDGVWNDVGARLDFEIAPTWYQTDWFRIACVAAFLALICELYQLRLQQLRKQFNVRLQERVNERTRIARELHDTLLQSLHGVMFEFQAVRNMFRKRPEKALEALDDAIMGTERAIIESQDAIEDLRSTTVVEGDLAQLLKMTGEDLVATRHADDDSATFGLTVEGQTRALIPAIRDEIYRIARELLRNAFRHARALRIEAEILFEEDQVRVRVRDDGKGIDPQVLKEGRRPGHWGLPGIRERAQQIGAKLDVWSEGGAGTEVQLAVAASIAYQKPSTRSRLGMFRRTGNHEH